MSEKNPAMDFKGITWAGDIYEKFEAMRLDVQEVMYEETIKYLENQAQKVGVSVKKFCAEIMQDLVPPSCVGPVKVAAEAELPPEPYTLTDINKKPKQTISDNHGELNNKQAGVEDIRNSTAQDSTPNVHTDEKCLSPTSPPVLVGNARSEECFRKSKRAGLTRRSISIKRISHPPKVSRASICSVASDDLNVTTLAEFFARHDPSEAVAKNRPISDASDEPCNSDQILSAESVKQEKKDKELLGESLRQNNDAMKCNSSCHGLTPAPIDTLRKDGSLSQINSNITETREVGSVGEEAIASYEDNFDIEIIEPIEKSKLEESCILVEVDELHFVSRGSKKHKSYKKKIYDVLSLKLRSTKKQDLCISEHDDLRNKNNAVATGSSLATDRDERKLSAHDSCDFGWELL